MLANSMKKVLFGMFVVCVCGLVPVTQAIGRDDGNGDDRDSNSTVTVTESETIAKLICKAQTHASGAAEWTSITTTDSTTNTSKTNSKLSVSVRKLTLTDGSTLTFAINGASIGTGTVKKGRASLRLSSKKGDTVPSVGQNDTLTVIDTDGTTIDLTGSFGTVSTQTEKH